jgi:hypothetical protein
MSERSERCWTCGRPRGLAQQRGDWGLHMSPSIPRTGNPEDRPAQIANDLICAVSIYRNGGAGESTHLCDECLRVGLRAIRVQVSELLAELDARHSKDAELAELTERLAALQSRYYNVCFEHDRMQERLRELLMHVSDSADPEVVRLAEFEASRPRSKLS